MAHFTCSETQNKYTPNGTRTSWQFDFEYMAKTDIWVGFYNENTREWDQVPYWADRNVPPPVTNPQQVIFWSFENATTIQFWEIPNTNGVPNVFPPAIGSETLYVVPAQTEDWILIQRWTDVDPLFAIFQPGSSIKARDLNDNFEQLKLAIEDGRCKVPQWFYDWIERNLIRITEEQNRAGDWQWEGTLDDDDHFVTSAALNDRFQPFWQTNIPEAGALPAWRMPGKIWVDRANTVAKFWNQEQQVWEVFAGDGTPGQRGPEGPPGSFQVGDIPPLNVPIPGAAPPDPTSRALVSGDAWFNTDTGNLFVWYVDSNSGQWVNCSQAGPRGADGPRQRVFNSDDPPTQIDGEPIQDGDLWFNSDTAQLFIWYTDEDSSQWVNISGIPGPAGPEGPPGQGGGGNADFARLTAVAPIQVALSNANQDAEISFDLNTINGLP